MRTISPIIVLSIAITLVLLTVAFWALAQITTADSGQIILVCAGGSIIALTIYLWSVIILHLKERAAASNIQEVRLNAANDSARRLWSSLSHDLRTPLNSILGYTELVIEEIPEGAPETFKSDLERVKAAGFDLLGLVNDLLTLAEISGDNLALNLENVDIRGLVNDVTTVIEQLATQHHNRLIIHAPSTPCIVTIDAARLEKILLTLSTNAAKFTEDGTITIDVDYDSLAEQLTLRISDTGQGIDPRDLESIFEPYSEVHGATHVAGIRLAVCRRIVEEMQGTLSVDSTPGKGSSFTVNLPCSTASSTKPEDEDLVDVPTGPPHVLVIDENDDAADLLSRHLKRFGCEVTVSSDGAFGKDVAVNLKPDLIIMDTEMTSIDGWAVLQHLKYDSRTRSIPVVVCSGQDQRNRASELGAFGYLMKPVTASALFNAIIRVTGVRAKFTSYSLSEDGNVR